MMKKYIHFSVFLMQWHLKFTYNDDAKVTTMINSTLDYRNEHL